MIGQRRDGLGMFEALYSVISLLLILVVCVELCDAATVVDVYRLIQYDFAGVQFGSRLAGFNYHAGSMNLRPGADLSRTVIISHIYEANATLIRDFIAKKKTLGGLLFLLPRIFNPKADGSSSRITQSESQMRHTVIELENFLLQRAFQYPIYFAFENEGITAMLADIKKSDATGEPATATTGGYKLVVAAGAEPKKLAFPIITNIQGWLPGLKTGGDEAADLPTIAIIASYDTFGASPSLSSGSDSNGSGVAGLLEIARLFSLLYSEMRARGRFNLLFGLTSGGPYNYNGTRQWLHGFDQRIRETIEYVICLNSIGGSYSGDEFWIHVSKPPQHTVIKQIFEGFDRVAKETGVRIGLRHKKINISNPRVAWEHEQFSRSRVSAITFSQLSSPPDFLQHTGGLGDARPFVVEMAVQKAVKLVAESIARHIYGCEGKKIEVFAQNTSLAVNPHYIRSVLDLLSRMPRTVSSLVRDGDTISFLTKELAEHAVGVSTQSGILDGMFTFYDSSDAAKLHFYNVAGVTFDLLLLLVLGLYLILLFSILVIATRGIDDLINLFRRPVPRRTKSL